MEFGAIQCAPKKPYCLHCPLNDSCVALEKSKIAELPVKINKTKVRNRYFNYVVVIDADNKTVLQQRTGKGIWQNLWEFPLLELEREIDLEEIKQHLPTIVPIPNDFEIVEYTTDVIVHKLSHQHLYTRFWIVKTDTKLESAVAVTEIENYAVPVLIADFISAFKNSYF